MEFSEAFIPERQAWKVDRIVGRRGKKKLEPWVDVRLSGVRDAGDGVFAARKFKRGRKLGYYTGKILRKSARFVGSYALDCSNVTVDGARCGSWTRKINDGSHGKNAPGCNVEFAEENLVRATRDIAPGEELFIDYGDGYWAT